MEMELESSYYAAGKLDGLQIHCFPDLPLLMFGFYSLIRWQLWKCRKRFFWVQNWYEKKKENNIVS